jgi:hypothetical protein
VVGSVGLRDGDNEAACQGRVVGNELGWECEDGKLEGSEEKGSKDARFVGLKGSHVGNAVVSMASVIFKVGRSEIEGVEVGSGTGGE